MTQLTQLTTYRPVAPHEFKKPHQCSKCGQVKQIAVLRNDKELICGDCAKGLGLLLTSPHTSSHRIIDSIKEFKDLEKLHEFELRTLLLSREQLAKASQFQKDCHFEALSILAKRQRNLYISQSAGRVKLKKRLKKKESPHPKNRSIKKSKPPEVILREERKRRRKLARRNLRRQEEDLLLTIYKDFSRKGLRLPEKGWRKVILNRVQNLGMSWTRGHLDSIVRRLRRRGFQPPLASILEYSLGLLRQFPGALSPEDICDNIRAVFGIEVNPNYVSWILKTESDRRDTQLLRHYDHSRFAFTYQYVSENGSQNLRTAPCLPMTKRRPHENVCLNQKEPCQRFR